MNILMDEPLDNLSKITLSEVVEAIRRVRVGEMRIEPGFDGQYGIVKIFNDKEKMEKQLKLL